MKAESGQASLHHSLHCPRCRRREPPILAADAQADFQGCARYELLGLLHKRKRPRDSKGVWTLLVNRRATRCCKAETLSGQEGWDAMQVERRFLQQESTGWDLTQLCCAPMPTSAGLARVCKVEVQAHGLVNAAALRNCLPTCRTEGRSQCECCGQND
jgi:hypothetical protein